MNRNPSTLRKRGVFRSQPKREDTPLTQGARKTSSWLGRTSFAVS